MCEGFMIARLNLNLRLIYYWINPFFKKGNSSLIWNLEHLNTLKKTKKLLLLFWFYFLQIRLKSGCCNFKRKKSNCLNQLLLCWTVLYKEGKRVQYFQYYRLNDISHPKNRKAFINLYAEKSTAPSLRNEKMSFENYQMLKNYLYILYEIEKNRHTKQTNKATLFILIRQQKNAIFP